MISRARLDANFPTGPSLDAIVPVWCLTPADGRCLHRFFDTSPIDPSGRLLAVLRLPFEDRLPKPGDAAHIVVVDLHSGTESILATTRGWETQLGAQINWAGPRRLVFNDVEPGPWQPFAVRLDLAPQPKGGWAATPARLAGTVYHASHDGQLAASACMKRMRWTQKGYGVVVPDSHVPDNFGPSTDDGLTLTSIESGHVVRRISAARIVEQAGPDELRNDNASEFRVHTFHTKWSPNDDRLIVTIRWFPAEGTTLADAPAMQPNLRFAVYTLTPDGSDIRLAVPPERWAQGGHHINFHPAGDSLSMNLACFDGMKFVACAFDGSGLEPILHQPRGSGHPTIHPTTGHILTDAYLHEPVALGDGTVPLRWIDPRSGHETRVARVPIDQPAPSVALRVDPHPAWDRSYRWVTFNAFIEGTRRVFIADMRDLVRP